MNLLILRITLNYIQQKSTQGVNSHIRKNRKRKQMINHCETKKENEPIENHCKSKVH
jgi:hypothetical protein